MVAKDGGYAWVVLVASFIIQFAGIGFSIGGVPIMLMSFANEFPHEDKAKLSLIASFRCFQTLAGPLAVLVIKLCGCRIATVTGALLSAAGIALSAFSSELWHVYLSYGIAGGIGVALTYTASSAAISDYFDKKRKIAFPVACLGNGLGVLVLPYLLQLLLDHRGHQETLYYTAAFKVTELIGGLLYLQPVGVNCRRTENYTKNPQTVVANDQDSLSTKRAANRKNESKRSKPGESPAALATDCLIASQTRFLNSYETNQVITVDERPTESLVPVQSNVATVIPHTAKTTRARALVRMLRPLGQWQCWCLLLNGFCWGFSVLATEMLLPTYINERGVGKEKASLGLTLIGGGILVSSLFVIVTGPKKYERLLVYSLTSVTLGVITTLATISDLYQVYLGLCCLYGIALGFLLSLFMGTLADAGDVADFADLFGLYIMFNGAGGLCGPAVIGILQASKGNDFGWYICGGVGTLGSLFALPLYLRRQQSSQHFSTY